MRRILVLFCFLALWPCASHAQGLLGDLMSGEWNPKVGTWAWYNLKDASTGQEFLVRMAIVDREPVEAKDGYWLEIEIVPRIGYPSVYKILLTGPAKDPANIRRMICRDGTQEPREMAVDSDAAAENTPGAEKKSLGTDEVEALDKKKIRAEHFELSDAEGKTDVWLNEEVRPMGLVKLKSPRGEFILRNNGVGGDDAKSVIDRPPVAGVPKDEVKVEVSVDKAPKQDKAKKPKKGPEASGPGDDKAKGKGKK